MTIYSGPLVSRQEALTARIPRYFTGVACTSGHIAQRYTGNYRCIICFKAYMVKFNKANIEQNRVTDRIRKRSTYGKNPEKSSRANTQRILSKKIAAAGRPPPDICEICGDTPVGKKFKYQDSSGIAFDHCHKTGRFRGWICDRCNKTLGLCRDSASLLDKLQQYIELHNFAASIAQMRQ